MPHQPPILSVDTMSHTTTQLRWLLVRKPKSSKGTGGPIWTLTSQSWTGSMCTHQMGTVPPGKISPGPQMSTCQWAAGQDRIVCQILRLSNCHNYNSTVDLKKFWSVLKIYSYNRQVRGTLAGIGTLMIRIQRKLLDILPPDTSQPMTLSWWSVTLPGAASTHSFPLPVNFSGILINTIPTWNVWVTR